MNSSSCFGFVNGAQDKTFFCNAKQIPRVCFFLHSFNQWAMKKRNLDCCDDCRGTGQGGHGRAGTEVSGVFEFLRAF
ncbi:MAG: hypothetical protein CSA96_01490 [Bacteroidetes bacterium]|nr:MAG: hypothetical protein CSA96_01490 [Bacteroidota bacterium]